jgi:hypothetical protein
VAAVQGPADTVSGEISRLLAKYSGLHASDLTHPSPRHGMARSIKTTGKAIRLDPVKVRIAKEEFMQLEKVVTVRRSTSCLSFPLHMVHKKDGCW